MTNNQLVSSLKYPLFVNIVNIHKVATQIFLALAQPTPECLMSDAGQVTADEGEKVGRWAGHQWCSGVPKYPHSLQLRRRLHKRLHNLANAPWHQPAPSSTRALVRSCCWRRRTFLHRFFHGKVFGQERRQYEKRRQING